MQSEPHDAGLAQPRWHLVYLALVGFVLLAVGVSLLVNHHLVRRYTASIRANQDASLYVAHVAELSTEAAAAKLQTDLIVERRDPGEGVQRLQAAEARFEQKLAALRVDLTGLGTPSVAGSMQRRLDTAEAHFAEQAGLAREVVARVAEQHWDGVADALVRLDRSYMNVARCLGDAQWSLLDLQSQQLEEHAVSAQRIRRLEVWITALLTLVVLGIAAYGYAVSGSLKRTHEAVRRSEARYRGVVDGQMELVCRFDPDLTLTFVNDAFCRFFGSAREALLGRPLPCVVDQRDREAVQEFTDRLTRGGEGPAWEHELSPASGEPRWHAWSGRAICDEHGGVIEYQVCGWDITDRKRVERQVAEAKHAAEAANASKSEFLANMSHEIRTPMTAILGYTELLTERLSGSEPDTAEALYTIKRNGEHLMTVINDILDLSKIESGKLTVERLAVSPWAIVDEVVSLLRVRAVEKGLTLDVEFAQAVPETIQTDPVRLRQILLNLVGNAIKFTETGGVRLVVRVDDRDQAHGVLRFEVADTGIGMTPEQLGRLFHPFTQADASTTRRFGGTGLRLTISRRLARALGGDIEAYSRPDEGSSFVLRIDAGRLQGVGRVEHAREAMALSARERREAAPDDGPLTGRVLLAEDGPDNQRLISMLLRKKGLAVELAENGRVALDRAIQARDAGEPFDLILMDMQMPGMDGFTATRELRQRGYDRPIVALTAHAMEEDRRRCFAAGCDGFASKPIQKAELFATIRRWLGVAASEAA